MKFLLAEIFVSQHKWIKRMKNAAEILFTNL